MLCGDTAQRALPQWCWKWQMLKTVPLSCTAAGSAPLPVEISSQFVFLAGILKFHEYYLGDSLTENAGDFHEANSVALQTVTNSALEQYISSVREALGVDSYYTR